MNPLAFIALIIVIAAPIALIGWGCTQRLGGAERKASTVNPDTNKNMETPSFAPPVTSAQLTRAGIGQRLKILAASPLPPSGKPEVACCYAPMALPQRAEYVCPACGEKTIYALALRPGESGVQSDDYGLFNLVQGTIPNCRRMLPELRALSARMDERAFCRTCSPQARNPQLILVIQLKDDPAPRRIPIASTDDLTLIQEFLEGNLLHQSGQIGAAPLRNFSARLAELFGVPQTEK